MTSYSSRGRKVSGVIAYEIGLSYIIVQFTSGQKYKYTYATAGKAVIEEMKLLAEAQVGLNTFINYNQPGFE